MKGLYSNTLFLLLVLVGLSACGDRGDTRLSALGKEGIITVIADSATWEGPVGDALRDELGSDILTLPNNEPHFHLERVDMDGPAVITNAIKKRKYVIIAAVLDEQTTEGRLMRASLDSASAALVRQQRAVVVQQEDLWYRNQMVVYATGATTGLLAQEIATEGETLRYVFNLESRKQVTNTIFRRGRQENKEKAMMDKHDFAINVQHDFVTPKDTTDFIWLRRILGDDNWRSIFVHYIEDADPSILTTDWIYKTRDSLTSQYLKGTLDGWVEIDRRRELETENINFLDRYGFETRGLWHMVGFVPDSGRKINMGGGGPFITYTFYEEKQQRIYMIDAMVFAPKFDKREFLRHMEATAYTFRPKDLEVDLIE